MSSAVVSSTNPLNGVNDHHDGTDHGSVLTLRQLDHEPPPNVGNIPRIPPDTPLLSDTRFSRRVSFNNLHQDWAETEPPAWNPLYTQNGNYDHFSDPNFGYGNSTVNDILKAYSQQPVKKKLKLPAPPSKSILKNKVSLQQLEYNSMARDVAVECEDDFTDNNKTLTLGEQTHAAPPPAAPSSRRKLYLGMTDEELMALDPQFKTTKAKTSNMENFKFDSQTTYYLPSRRPSTSTIGSQPAPRQVMYPSSNENNYKSISLTVKHNQFDQFPYNRTILTVLSGRRHTWNSVDWLLLINQSLEESATSFLQDGDYLVISALIPLKFLNDYKKHAKKPAALDDYLYKKCENLLNYIVNNELLKANDLRLKITVELVTDNDPLNGHIINPRLTGTKYMLQHLFKQYQPSIVVVGNKSSNLNFKYPLKIKKQNQKDEFLIKLSSFVVKYSPVPVVLVGNSTEFHNKTGREAISSSAESIESTESFTGPECDFGEQLATISESQSESRFEDMIKLISDKSLGDSRYYLEALNSKDDNLKLDSKIHSIYRSQTTGHRSNSLHRMTSADSSTHEMYSSNDPIYKVRSLISYNEEKELKNDKLRKDLKRNRTRNSVSSKSTVGSDKKDAKDKKDKKEKKSLWQKLGLKK
ncbi:uncharacterized protein CANTADRAFT_53277 [Suhomyces tanzawaensis NRRL Y-17324]|uniref:Uncharacterized protein n=1 Tax=Suhomyces tanzawaensis NRRL Y-17324 TaxID=984487 RepID=A0A1E4SGV4_9ASCO|nr:uncharacterized protein CANTADRAFT_53277 [Suhomyces tanzawaensis NRRL Y-17324]ODV78747.1 hypothetical protein CANTADRAFT_53277 [Suhomyces tanzawaensis NRRL Y-17324]